jgi:capsular exopolysaccharide synthesis family protein
MQFTSPCKGEGKTTLATNVAISLAHSGKKVLLIDADFRRPRLHEVWGLPNEVGFTSVLSGQATPPEAIQPTDLPSLSVLPSGPLPISPSELLSSGKVQEQLASLRAAYDFILVDTPPLLSVSDPTVVAPFVDAIVLTLGVDKQSRPNAQRAQTLLNSLGLDRKVLGVVVNLRGCSAAYSDGYYAAAAMPV